LLYHEECSNGCLANSQNNSGGRDELWHKNNKPYLTARLLSVRVSDKPSVQEAQYVAHIIILVYKMRMKARKQTVGHPITNLERLAAELRKIRRGRKVSQQELSDRAMVARRTITNAEGAENVGVKELCRIANGLGYELVLRPKNTVVFEELSATFKDDE